MGFDPTKVLAAGELVKTASEEVRNHMNDYATREQTKHNGKSNRKINEGKAKTDNVVNIIGAIGNTGNTVADIYNKIITSNNATQEIKNKAEDSKRNYELQLKEIDKKYGIEDKKYGIEMEKIKASREDKEREHEIKMKQLDIEQQRWKERQQLQKEKLQFLYNLMKEELKNNSRPEVIRGYISDIDTAINTLYVAPSVNQIEMR